MKRHLVGLGMPRRDWRYLGCLTGYASPADTRHDMNAGTKEVQVATKLLEDNKTTIELYDTPGFDDSDSEDQKLFEDLARWLAQSQNQRTYLNGVILMQSITSTRVADSERQKLQLFKEIVGPGNYDKVAIVTTMWDSFSKPRGEKNEQNRSSGVWKDMMDAQAKIIRFHNTEESAAEIVQHFTSSLPQQLLLQKELYENHGWLGKTSAGREMERQIGDKIESIQLAMKKLGVTDELQKMVQKMQGWLRSLKSFTVSALSHLLRGR